MRNLWMAEELLGLTKQSGPLLERKPADWLASKMQRRKMMSTGRELFRRPSSAMNMAGRLGRLTSKGLTSGFHGGIGTKALHGLFLASPALTAVSMAKHPEAYQGQKGKTIGESIGATVGGLASHRLPFVGQLLASEVGGRVGRRIGHLADR